MWSPEWLSYGRGLQHGMWLTIVSMIVMWWFIPRGRPQRELKPPSSRALNQERNDFFRCMRTITERFKEANSGA